MSLNKRLINTGGGAAETYTVLSKLIAQKSAKNDGYGYFRTYILQDGVFVLDYASPRCGYGCSEITFTLEFTVGETYKMELQRNASTTAGYMLFLPQDPWGGNTSTLTVNNGFENYGPLNIQAIANNSSSVQYKTCEFVAGSWF